MFGIACPEFDLGYLGLSSGISLVDAIFMHGHNA